MNNKLLSALILCTPIAFAAAPVDGMYTSVFGGYSYLPSNINILTPYGFVDGTSYKSGYNAGGRIGYQGNPIRYEAEYTYINATLNAFNVNQLQQAQPAGNAVANLIMANLYYDTQEILPCVTSFLGLGIGYAYLDSDLNGYGVNGINYFKFTDNAFAYQGTAGLTYNFSENYAVNLSYRYVATTSKDVFGNVFQAHLVGGGAVYRFDYGNYK